MNFPKSTTLIEVGPRDGFQFEKKRIPLSLKLEIISGLAEAGLKHIQAASFVHPERMPQMADAEELIRHLSPKEGVVFSGLVLNRKGVERARDVGLKHIEVSISASDTHSRKNSGMSLAQAIEQGKEMIRLAREYRMIVRAGIQCAFGCVYEGDIPTERVIQIAKAFTENGADRLCLADTTGMANPLSIKKTLTGVQSLCVQVSDLNPLVPVILHLHDTRGLGLVNLMTALECGITHFDTALAGMGGCPFVMGAAGNIATEDTAYLLNTLNIETGIDIPKVSACSRKLEKFFGKSFSGKIYRMEQMET